MAESKRARLNLVLLFVGLAALLVTMAATFLGDTLEGLRDLWLAYLGWLFLAASVVCGVLVLKRPDSRPRVAWRNVTLIVGFVVNCFVVVACILIDRMMRFW